MKFLNQFVHFDWDRFIAGKILICNGTAPWTDRDTGALLGTKVECAIAEDATEYDRKAGDTTNNRYDKFTIKVEKPVVVPANAKIKPVGVTATVYGDYRNQLSVKATDIEIIRDSKS